MKPNASANRYAGEMFFYFPAAADAGVLGTQHGERRKKRSAFRFPVLCCWYHSASSSAVLLSQSNYQKKREPSATAIGFCHYQFMYRDLYEKLTWACLPSAFDIFSPLLVRFSSSADEINDKFIGKKFPSSGFCLLFDGGKSLLNESSVWRLADVNGPSSKKGK
jgi:hypothetical protein